MSTYWFKRLFAAVLWLVVVACGGSTPTPDGADSTSTVVDADGQTASADRLDTLTTVPLADAARETNSTVDAVTPTGETNGDAVLPPADQIQQPAGDLNDATGAIADLTDPTDLTSVTDLNAADAHIGQDTTATSDGSLADVIGDHGDTITSETTSVGSGLTLTTTGSGIDQQVSIEAKGQFRLVFEAADNWGIAQWYDLVNDPQATTNLAYSSFSDPGVREAGLFQMVWYGTTPDDPKLYMFAAKYYQPQAARSFSVLENTAQRIVVEATAHPLLAAGVLENLTVVVRYYIYPNGKLYIRAKMTATAPQTISEWRCAVLGLADPPNTLSACPDKAGWIRASANQNPYSWSGSAEPYLFAYWSAQTPQPYANWSKASILLVPSIKNGGNLHLVDQNCHGWTAFKRWYYRSGAVSMSAGQTITHHYLLQLGTTNSTVLPNLTTTATCDPIADAYQQDPTPPGKTIP